MWIVFCPTSEGLGVWKEKKGKRKEKRKFEIFLETTLVIFIGCWGNRKRSVFFFRLAVLSVEVDVCG